MASSIRLTLNRTTKGVVQYVNELKRAAETKTAKHLIGFSTSVFYFYMSCSEPDYEHH